MLYKSLLKSQKKGFTLIELLVVIAIIALLLSILMPALQAVKEQTRTIVCAAHLKQWGIIMGFFAADNGDQFPDAEHSTAHSTDSHGQWWLQPILPYVGDNHKILICAKARIPAQVNPNDINQAFPQNNNECWGSRQRCNDNNANQEWVWSSYGPNGWLMDPILPNGNQKTWGAPSPPVPVSSFWGKMENIGTPSKVPFYLDSRWVDAWPDENDSIPNEEGPSQNDGFMNHFLMIRHGKAVNAVFFDGSARKVDLQDLWRLKWHKTFDVNGPMTQPGVDFKWFN